MPLLKPSSTLGKRIVRVSAAFALLYLLLCAAVCAWQRRLLYFPTVQDPRAANEMAARDGFQPWRNIAGDIIGWKLPATGSPTGSVLIVHGNAGCALNRDYLARPIHEAASRDVYVLEYPGYGVRAGSPSMKSILAAGEEAFALLPHHMPIHVVSESLGTGVAAYLAKMHTNQVAGLMLFAPYNKLASVGQRQMPFLPVWLLLRDRFNPEEWLKDYREPVVMVIAGADQVIPPEFGRRLYDSYGGPKRLQVVPGAGHNDVTTQSPAWWSDTFNFLQQSPTSSGK